MAKNNINDIFDNIQKAKEEAAKEAEKEQEELNRQKEIERNAGLDFDSEDIDELEERINEELYDVRQGRVRIDLDEDSMNVINGSVEFDKIEITRIYGLKKKNFKESDYYHAKPKPKPNSKPNPKQNPKQNGRQKPNSPPKTEDKVVQSKIETRLKPVSNIVPDTVNIENN